MPAAPDRPLEPAVSGSGSVTDGGPPAPDARDEPAAMAANAQSALARLAIPVFAVVVVMGFVVFATLRWDAWVGSATIQTTDDAYIRADLTKMSSRVAGQVVRVAVSDPARQGR